MVCGVWSYGLTLFLQLGQFRHHLHGMIPNDPIKTLGHHTGTKDPNH